MSEMDEMRETLGARAGYPLWAPPELAPAINAALLRLAGQAPLPPQPIANVDIDAVIRRVMASTTSARRYLAAR